MFPSGVQEGERGRGAPPAGVRGRLQHRVQEQDGRHVLRQARQQPGGVRPHQGPHQHAVQGGGGRHPSLLRVPPGAAGAGLPARLPPALRGTGLLPGVRLQVAAAAGGLGHHPLHLSRQLPERDHGSSVRAVQRPRRGAQRQVPAAHLPGQSLHLLLQSDSRHQQTLYSTGRGAGR